MYLYKDMYVWKFPAYILCLEKDYQEIFMNRLGDVNDIYLSLYLIFDTIKDIDYKGIKLENFSGIVLRNNSLSQSVLIDLIQYYLVFNNLYLYKSSVYRKVKNSLVSYELVGSIEEVLYKGFIKNVVGFYTSYFEDYVKGLDFSFLVKNYLIKLKSNVLSIKDISTNRIDPDFSVIEFSDGLYFIKYDRFISKKDVLKMNKRLEITTVKYYNKSYG